MTDQVRAELADRLESATVYRDGIVISKGDRDLIVAALRTPIQSNQSEVREALDLPALLTDLADLSTDDLAAQKLLEASTQIVRMREALEEAIAVFESWHDDETEVELLPRLRAALSRTPPSGSGAAKPMFETKEEADEAADNGRNTGGKSYLRSTEATTPPPQPRAPGGDGGEPVAWVVRWTTPHTPRNVSAYPNERDAQQAAKNLGMYADASNIKVIPAYAALPGAVDSGQREPGFIKPDNDRQVFFYEQDFYVLSNFSAFRVRWIGIDFDTSEHAYHFLKFRPDFDNGTDDHRRLRGEIMHARSAHEAFKLAETNKHLRRPDWDEVKVETMRNLIRAKADQHEYVRRKLLATGYRELIEDSWRDDFWGWGPNRDGKNMLGKLWMEVRAELRSAALSPKGDMGSADTRSEC